MQPESCSTGYVAPPILPADNLLRRMRESDVYADGRVKKAAFKPRKNGLDRDGLSVSVEDPQYRQQHRATFELPGKLTATIQVKAVYEIGLDVRPDPDPSDPRHALITGIPDLTLGEKEQLEAERFAELLARHASQYTFPEN